MKILISWMDQSVVCVNGIINRVLPKENPHISQEVGHSSE